MLKVVLNPLMAMAFALLFAHPTAVVAASRCDEAVTVKEPSLDEIFGNHLDRGVRALMRRLAFREHIRVLDLNAIRRQYLGKPDEAGNNSKLFDQLLEQVPALKNIRDGEIGPLAEVVKHGIERLFIRSYRWTDGHKIIETTIVDILHSQTDTVSHIMLSTTVTSPHRMPVSSLLDIRFPAYGEKHSGVTRGARFYRLRGPDGKYVLTSSTGTHPPGIVDPNSFHEVDTGVRNWTQLSVRSFPE